MEFIVTNEKIDEIVQEFNNDLAEIYLSPAFEDTIASNDTVNNDEGMQANKAAEFGERIKKHIEALIKQLQGIVTRAITKISNFIKRVGQTDKGFEKMCRGAMLRNKPYNNVVLVSYQYNDEYLNTMLQKETAGVQSYLETLKTTYQSMKDEVGHDPTSGDEAEAGGVTPYILKKYCNASSDTTTLDQFFVDLRNNFRSEKREITYTASNARTYYNITRDYSKINLTVQASATKMNQMTNSIKSTMEAIFHNAEIDNDVKRIATNKFKKATEVYTFHVHFLDLYSQLKVEEVMTYREVLKRLYHF